MSELTVPERKEQLQHLRHFPPKVREDLQHQKQIKRAQQILGALLWLSARTRPDLSYTVSAATSVPKKDLRELEVRLRHLLQYVMNPHPHFGLHFPCPTSWYLSLETSVVLEQCPAEIGLTAFCRSRAHSLEQ